MAKILVERNICDACGADVRPGSLFCYNCGGAVGEVLTEAATNNNNSKDDGARFQSNLAENSDLKTTRLKKETVEGFDSESIAKPIEKPAAAELSEKTEAQPLEKSSFNEDAKLKSAASLRRKAKNFQRKTVEIVWEEPENAPNKLFPIVAIVLILFVAAIFYLAMYLK
jgi:uncharacterized Zn finger protein (UPF0148 family)